MIGNRSGETTALLNCKEKASRFSAGRMSSRRLCGNNYVLLESDTFEVVPCHAHAGYKVRDAGSHAAFEERRSQ